MKTVDLSGNWKYKTDTDNKGVEKGFYNTPFDGGDFVLPGSACENKVGKKQEYYDEFSKDAVRAPRERYEYIAPLWLSREVEIPREFENKCIKLFLERVNIASQLWVDGEKVGRQLIELSTPHIYNLTGKLSAGKHTFVLKVDNRNLLNLDRMASGYSIDTQGYWNGIIGKIELRCEDICHIENIQIYPDDSGIDIRLTQVCEVYSPLDRAKSELEFTVIDPNGKKLKTIKCEKELFNSHQPDYFRYDIDDIQFWDEFNPNLYTLNVKYKCGGDSDEKEVKFGMRTVKTENKRILLNNRQISLRGTIDCAIYPITGYPPTDLETWVKNFRTIKNYGLNHVRFHAWCPPENAFAAADMLGIYVSVEMPLWLNKDVCALETGDDMIHRQYFDREALEISKAYGNHPSFIMFSNGNENMGDFELLEDITIRIKAYDKRRIYTVTSNFDHPVLPCEDYLCAFEAGGKRVRIQNMHDDVAENTCIDYAQAVNDVNVPIVSFEVGQYCVYPDVDIADRYTGNMMPVNFEVIRNEMRKKGVYDRVRDYIKASGDLAVKLYKEDIEAALRTENFGGFELLSLTDYTGQSTATVGILDVMFESKGIVTPEEWRGFCGDVVPLFKAKRIFKNTDVLCAQLGLYDFGRVKIENPVFEVRVRIGNETVFEMKTSERTIEIPLEFAKASALAKVSVKVGEYENSWRIFIFAEENEQTVELVKTQERLSELIKNGGRAIVGRELFNNPIAGSFIPVFWSPVHFPSQKPCGAIIDDKHPIFKYFPTEKYPDYQWKRLFDGSVGMSIAENGVDPIVEYVPNFVDNTPSSPLFEAKMGNARLLFAGFDLEGDAPEIKAFKNAAARYVMSEDFAPSKEISL